MNKIFSMFIIAIILINVSFVSADKTDFLEFGEYGQYELWDTFLGFKTNLIASYELQENTDLCGFNKCYAIGTVEVFEKTRIFDKIKYEDLGGKELKLKKSEVYYSLPPTIEQKEFPVYTSDCNEVTHQNGSIQDVCTQTYSYSDYEDVLVYDWQKLGQKKLDPGIYSWKITGEIIKSTDWIIQVNDQEFTEWAVWDPGLTEKLIAYYSFNTGEPLVDIALFRNNLTIGRAPANGGNTTLFKGGDGSLYCGEDGYIDTITSSLFNVGSTGAISFWIYNIARDDRYSTPIYFHTGSSDRLYMWGIGTAIDRTSAQVDGAETAPNTPALNIGQWHNIVINWNNSKQQLWLDGAVYSSRTGVFSINLDTMVIKTLCSDGNLGNDAWLQGHIDELAYYNDTLTGAEILLLNDSAFFSPAVTSFNITSPLNNSVVFAGEEVIFNVTAFDFPGNIENASLYINDTFNDTVIFGVPTDPQEIIFNKTFSGLGVHSWYISVFDDLGSNMNTSEMFFDVRNFVINSQTFNNKTIESSLEDFLLNVTLYDGLSITAATFYYDNQTEIGQVFTVGVDTIIRVVNFSVPGVVASQNFTFNWTLSLSNGSDVKTDNKTQQVDLVNVGNCTTYSNIIYNFTLVDEEFQTPLSNSTIEVAMNIFDSSGTIIVAQFSQEFNDTNPVGICLNIVLSNDTTLLANSVIKYQADGYAIEYYNIDNAVITADTALQNIILYDLNLSDSTDFQLTFTDSNFLPVENALVFVNRQYVSENIFKTVELPRTDVNGQTVVHLVRNDIVYDFVVTLNGTVQGTFQNLNAFCDDVTIGDCKINLNAFLAGQEIFDYYESLGLTFTNPVYDDLTRNVNFNFLVTDGSTRNVSMSIERNDILGNRTVCEVSTVSSGGSLNCLIPLSVTDSTLIVFIASDDEPVIKDYITIASDNFGDGGFMIAFVYMLAFILIFSNSKNGTMIGIVIGFIASLSLGLIEGLIIGAGATGIWLILIVILVLIKLNKDKLN